MMIEKSSVMTDILQKWYSYKNDGSILGSRQKNNFFCLKNESAGLAAFNLSDKIEN